MRFHKVSKDCKIWKKNVQFGHTVVGNSEFSPKNIKSEPPVTENVQKKVEFGRPEVEKCAEICPKNGDGCRRHEREMSFLKKRLSLSKDILAVKKQEIDFDLGLILAYKKTKIHLFAFYINYILMQIPLLILSNHLYLNS